jgi:hypothetical protein
MKQDTFQKSLIATARLTCCASLFSLGCTNDTSTDSGSQIQECEEVITNKFQAFTILPMITSQKVKDCCQLAIEYHSEISENIFELEYLTQCCDALDWPTETLACTPWGPPMPPKFASN